MPLNSIQPNFFLNVLGKNPAADLVQAKQLIRNQFPDQAMVICDDLSLSYYADLGHCRFEPRSSPAPCFKRHWGGEDYDQLYSQYQQVIWSVEWQNHQLLIVELTFSTSCGENSLYFVLADQLEIVDGFVLDVARKTHHPGEAILTFSHGYWQRSVGLYQAIQSASFEDLILADDLKQQIREDFHKFLAAEDRYKELGITWRRGALLIGPPGNGKTHFVRALVKELGIACLYVQSLKHPYHDSDQMWKQVFSRARGLTPCILILEDLDSLIDEENRSFFLNQLDGFEENHGLIVLATTNYPERIDAGIVNRPSRFDRKYHFLLPHIQERMSYFQTWQTRLAPELNWTEEVIQQVADQTDGFSFAYLKELMVSSLMDWMHETEQPFVESVLKQARLLRQQMETTTVAQPAPQE